MRWLKIAVAGLILVAAAGLLGAGLYAHAQSAMTSACGDPTAACWTRGRTVYQGIPQTWGFGILPGWVIPQNAGVRFLNTGPDIPHLVVATNTQGGRAFSAPVATLRTADGSRLLATRGIRAAGGIHAWDLGPVPDGAVIWFQVHVRKTKSYPTQAWEHLYGNITGSGGVDWSAPVHGDPAMLRGE